MIRRLICFALLGAILIGSMAYALDPRSAQQPTPRQTVPGSGSIQKLPKVQLTPEYLMSQISLLKGQVYALQQQVASLQSSVSMTTQLSTRLGKLESILQTDATGHVTITAASSLKIIAPVTDVNAGTLNVQSGMSGFHGVLKADTVISNNMVASSYSPGAGNIW